MCLSSSPKAPPPPAKAPEAAEAPVQTNTGDVSDRDKRRRAAASGGSSRSTILTSSRGVQSSGATAVKTLLGQ